MQPQRECFKHIPVACTKSPDIVKLVKSTTSPKTRPPHDWFDDQEEIETGFDWAA